jgi:hypothetical protein
MTVTPPVHYGLTIAKGQAAIGTTNPAASSILDITSTSKGMLTPRMTGAQQNAISSPATGLLIYNTDSTAFCYYNGSAWQKISSGGSSVTPSALTKVDDTNVTLTLGGSPSTSLLAATSLTLGWTGTLADSRITSAATWNAKLAFSDTGRAYNKIATGGGLTKVADSLGAIIATKGSGTVTSVATNTGSGITGGTITGSGTISADTLVLSTRSWRNKLADSLGALIENGTGTIFTVKKYQAMGSGIDAVSIPLELITSNTALTDNSLSGVTVWLSKAATISTVWFYQGTQGNYTADQYNGIGIYSYSGGTATLVASTTDDGNIWKGTANSYQSKALSSSVNLQPGLYYIVALYNNSAQTTAPTIGGSPNLTNAAVTSTTLFTNSARFRFTFAGQNTMPATITLSSTANNINVPFLGME